MASKSGTLELLARELGGALTLLEARLQEQGVKGLFADLGLNTPDSVLAVDGLVTAASNTSTHSGELVPLVTALAAAIKADADLGAIAAAAGAVLAKAKEVIADISALGAALSQAAAGLDATQRPLVEAFAAELPGRLLDLLLIVYTEARAQVLLLGLNVAGLVSRTEVPGSVADLRPPHTRWALHLDRVGDLIGNPEAYWRNVYGWGDPGFDGSALLSAIHRIITSLTLNADLLAPPGGPPTLEAYAFSLRADLATTPPSLVTDVRVPATGDVTGTFPLGDRWSLTVAASGRFVADMQGRITPPATVSVQPPTGSVTAGVSARLVGEQPSGAIVVLGQAGGTRLQAQRVSVGVGFKAEWDSQSGQASGVPTVSAELRAGKLIISLGGADSFLGRLLPGMLEVAADLAADWNPADGLTVAGGAGLAIQVPLVIHLGPASIDRLDLALRIGDTLSLELQIAGGIDLGPFAASVEGVGAGIDLRLHPGNLGPVDLGFHFIPPTGLGLAIDAGPIKGGGFIRLDVPNGRYAGVFNVSVGPVGATVIGLLDTRLPGRPNEYSLLIVLRASFPPIQVGFGFALSSIGGLLGLNRRVNIDELRARFATGAVGRILAPEDPVRNAPILLADLNAVFPPASGVTILGPTLQLSWVEIVRVDLGLFVELPAVRVVLLGSLKMALANPAGRRPLAQIRLDIIGLLDFGRRILEFDAVLIDSQLMEIFELTGGAAFRLSWGDEPYVVLSVGGFHPAWNPAPLVFPPSLTRIAMVLGAPTDFVYMRLSGYFAVTTNSLQFGAALELRINAGPIAARGFLGFDALIRFTPFSFQFDIYVSIDVRLFGFRLAGVDLSGTLAGPGPVILHGKVCIEILWFEICWEDTFTIGSSAPQPVPTVASAVAELVAELIKPANLRVLGGEDPYVVLAPPSENVTKPVLAPLGQLAWTQKKAPLDLLLQRFEATPLATPETVRASGEQVIGPELDWFAPGSFADLNDSETLNQRAFLRLNGGVRLGEAGVADGPSVTHTVTVQQIRLPEPDPSAVAFELLLPEWMLRAARTRSGHLELAPVIPALGVKGESWNVHAADGTLLAADVSEAQAHRLATLAPVPGAAVPATDLVPAMAF